MKILIYDGSCGICAKTINYLVEKRVVSKHELVAIKTATHLKEVSEKYHLSLEKFDEMILIDNHRRFNGYYAFKQLFKVSNSNMKYIFKLPFSDFFGNHLYKIFARKRHLFSKNSHCGIL